MNIRNLIVLFMVTTGLFSQTVNGTVYDSNSRPLEGANVVLVGTELGDTANDAGAYSILSVPAGTYELTASFIGYSSVTNSVVVGDIVSSVNFLLEVNYLGLTDVEVLASRAVATTHVAYTLGVVLRIIGISWLPRRVSNSSFVTLVKATGVLSDALEAKTSTSDSASPPTSKMKWVITPSSPTTIVSVIGLYPMKEAFSSYVPAGTFNIA